MRLNKTTVVGWQWLALLMMCLGLLMAGPASADQGPGLRLSPMRALQQAHWVAEGSTHPRHVIYTFVDANCPYCHKLWLALQSYQREGLQVRNVLVGVISASSPGKAAAIFSARSPAAAWRENEKRWGSRSDGGGGTAPLTRISSQDRTAIMDNETLMREFGITGTPGLVYADVYGKVHVIVGVPGKAKLRRIVRTAAVASE
ncbi:MAG: thiol:disulfide interchange protein DsbG [Gammaproteobacteria bacterium]